MMQYFFIKTLRLVITLLIIITMNFFIPHLMPGDPVIMLFGQDAVTLNHQELADLTIQFGLDKPLLQQFFEYLQLLASGNLGYSFHYRQMVSSVIGQHFIWTIILVLPAIFLSSLLAMILGLFAGWKVNSKTDLALTLTSLILYAFPQFLAAMLLLYFLGFKWQLFPLGGLYSTNADSTPAILLDVLWHLTLPVIVLTLSGTTAKFLVTRNSVATVRNNDYIRYAVAKGLSTLRILSVHVLKNACLPLLSMVALNIGFMVSGALIVEIVFSLNGMGSLIYEAALYRDYPVLQGCFLILTLFVVGANALVELLYGIIDPRIRQPHL